MTPNKAYFIRAVYDWIVDNAMTPYILVDATLPCVEVPQQFVNNGKIVLDISPSASRGLHIENERIVFTARFSGISTQVMVHPLAVIAIYASENGRGMEFGAEYNRDYPPLDQISTTPSASPGTGNKPKKPFLKLVDKDE
ncbi:MAG: ClpXP protease specificity-enhancing factor [Legionellaceae bacterium]|nr:ClpXP protease specificity-enhancing factor [Legionellaceae bacterium]